MDATVGDERFDRYYRRIRLGLRLMSHGARAQTASDWSGLTLDQLVTLRSLEGGERLCEAFEIYQEWEPDSHLEFDYAVLLATGVVKGEEIEISTCARCGCALLLDKLKIPQLRCTRCRSKSGKASPGRPRVRSH